MSKPFTPAFGLSNKHLQTLFSSFFRKVPKLNIEIEQFELNDGDFLECYWLNKPKTENNTPIAVIFHGLAGSFESIYIKGIMHKLQKKGFSCVLMHFRGCSGKMNRLPRAYHSGETGDALAWIKHLEKQFPNSALFALGYSLGGNMLLKLLGELKDDSPLKAAVSVSAPMQLDVCADKINSGFSRFYQHILMKNLKKMLKQKYILHDMETLIGLNEKEVDKLVTFWDFDAAYTAPIHGFDSAKEYYLKSSSKQFLKSITTDTLIIHALDDPFMTTEILPNMDELSSKVEIELSSYGGHVGFIGGTVFHPQYWLEDRITDFFTNFK